MMSSFLPYLILSCMLCKTVVTQVFVSADKSSPANGDTVTLTCNITSFILPSSWINDTSTSSGVLSICPPAGTCSPTTSGRYSFSATSSTSVAQISAFNASSDNFGWKCRHDTFTDVFIFKFTTTRRSVSSTTATTVTMTTTATLSTTSTEMRTTNIDMTTTNIEMTTDSEIGPTQSIETTSPCPPPVIIIIGVSVSGFLSFLLIFIICYCCPCCCLYNCRKEHITDKYEAEEANDTENAKNPTKAKVVTQNPAYELSNVPSKSSTSDTFKEVQPIDRTVNVLIQSSSPTVNQTLASDQVWENKSVPDKYEINESVQL